MTENTPEQRRGVFGRIRRFFSPKTPPLSPTFISRLAQISDKYTLDGTESRNKAFSVVARASGETIDVATDAILEALSGKSKEMAEVIVEVLVEDAQTAYEKARRSGNELEIASSELHIRMVLNVNAELAKAGDQFPSDVAYLSYLSPEARVPILHMLEVEAQTFREHADRTGDEEDFNKSRYHSKVLASARAIVSGNSPQAKP